MIRAVLFWGVVIVLVIWVMHHPGQASTDVHNMGSFLSGLAG